MGINYKLQDLGVSALCNDLIAITLVENVHIYKCHCLPNFKAFSYNRNCVTFLSWSHIPKTYFFLNEYDVTSSLTLH